MDELGQVPGHRVVALATAVVLTAALVDGVLTGHLHWIFDLAFVAMCWYSARAVRDENRYTVMVLPPLLMIGVAVLFAIGWRRVVGNPDDGFFQASVTGVATHGIGLAIGYGVALFILGMRMRHQHPDESTPEHHLSSQ